jgi:ribosomal protein S18 acetylase RimI-like enzyme
VILRNAETTDISAISALFLRCWKDSYANVLSQAVRDSMTEEASIKLWSNSLGVNPERETILGIEGDVLVGFFRIGPDKNDSTRGHLFSLYVDPELAGRGFGTKLLQNAVALIRSKGFVEMTLWVFEENTTARSFYEKFGFIPTGENKITPEWNTPEIEMLNSNITL